MIVAGIRSESKSEMSDSSMESCSSEDDINPAVRVARAVSKEPTNFHYFRRWFFSDFPFACLGGNPGL